jgi:hypothetical protein
MRESTNIMKAKELGEQSLLKNRKNDQIEESYTFQKCVSMTL